jgi:hypothetical protein
VQAVVAAVTVATKITEPTQSAAQVVANKTDGLVRGVDQQGVVPVVVPIVPQRA